MPLFDLLSPFSAFWATFQGERPPFALLDWHLPASRVLIPLERVAYLRACFLGVRNTFAVLIPACPLRQTLTQGIGKETTIAGLVLRQLPYMLRCLWFARQRSRDLCPAYGIAKTL